MLYQVTWCAMYYCIMCTLVSCICYRWGCSLLFVSWWLRNLFCCFVSFSMVNFRFWIWVLLNSCKVWFMPPSFRLCIIKMSSTCLKYPIIFCLYICYICHCVLGASGIFWLGSQRIGLPLLTLLICKTRLWTESNVVYYFSNCVFFHNLFVWNVSYYGVNIFSWYVRIYVEDINGEYCHMY
jgi:hypothetical protein